MLALIDGDALVYLIGFSCQHTSYYAIADEDVVWLDATTERRALEILEQDYPNAILSPVVTRCSDRIAYLRMNKVIRSILLKSNADSAEFYITSNDKSNFRFNVAKTKEYKGNRKKLSKPLLYHTLREYLVKKYYATVVYNEEADDAIGIRHYKALEDGDTTIICSQDKDLDQLCGWHYNLRTEEIYETEEFSRYIHDPVKRKLRGGGLKWFYAQMLLGDSADNIAGLRSYGPMKVKACLSDCTTEKELIETVFNEYVRTYSEDGIEYAKQRFLENADLLWIRRYPEELKSKYLKRYLPQKLKNAA